MDHLVSLSGGKDSTAMFLEMIERDYQIDGVYFADTLFEFPELYDYLDRIEEYTGYKIHRIKPEKGLFEKWLYGKVVRGNNKGKIRGMPLRAYPCWWTRESKVKPLAKIRGDADLFYVGIAYDELDRMSTTDDNIKYPLIEWKWTEQDCIDYLNKLGLFNCLYINFDRLGCFFCPKQSEKSLWILWKLYPELWKITKYWDKESKRVADHFIKELPLEDYQMKFEKGWTPKKESKYECWNGCESVKYAFRQRQSGLGMFCDIETETS